MKIRVIACLGAIVLFYLGFFTQAAKSQEEYAFDLSEIENTPYHLGGYIELRPVLFELKKDASFDSGLQEEYNLKLQLDASYEWENAGFYLETNTEVKKSCLGWSDTSSIYEGYLSIRPSSSFNLEIGKRQLKWGKGYAWNPVAFVDRLKNPDDPHASLEGFIIAKADYIKSFAGPLKSFALTPVLIPVYEKMNEDFGEINNINVAAKTYLLLFDTDFDIIVLTGEAKKRSYGFDFSKNIKTNFEIHGELAFINDAKEKVLNSSSKGILVGLRYLTNLDTTYIIEYYHNGHGFTAKEMEGDYLYIRISQKEPFDTLYFTPSITVMSNLNNEILYFSPEVVYLPVTNLDLRLKGTFLSGKTYIGCAGKQTSNRLELKIGYYF